MSADELQTVAWQRDETLAVLVSEPAPDPSPNWRPLVRRSDALARIEALEQERDAAYELLARIGDFAHDRSKGPAEWDPLWEIRAMAYEGVKP